MAHSLRYLANCSIMFTELPLPQRPAAAREAGFEAVEFWWPFDRPVPGDAAVDEFVAAIADAPGRGEPGSGRLDLDGYLSRLEQAGYDGWVALEYRPTASTLDSLGWLPRARRGGQPGPHPPG